MWEGILRGELLSETEPAAPTVVTGGGNSTCGGFFRREAILIGNTRPHTQASRAGECSLLRSGISKFTC